MKIDRFALFLLAGALAAPAVACQVYVGGKDPKTPAPHAPPPSAPPQAHGPTPPSGPTPPPQGAAAAKPIPLHLHGGLGAPSPEPAGGAPQPSAPAACLDTGAVALPSCSTLPPANPTCSTNTVPAQKCAVYTAYFDPKVAAAAISCMSALSSKQLCDASQSNDCGQAALAKACPDPSLGQLCSIAATSCKATTSDCTAILSGLNDSGKQQVAQCIAQGCSSGLAACVSALNPSSTPMKPLSTKVTHHR